MPTVAHVIGELETMTPDELVQVRRWLLAQVRPPRRSCDVPAQRSEPGRRIEAMRTAGRSHGEIAARMGLSTDCVREYLQVWRDSGGAQLVRWIPR